MTSLDNATEKNDILGQCHLIPIVTTALKYHTLPNCPFQYVPIVLTLVHKIDTKICLGIG